MPFAFIVYPDPLDAHVVLTPYGTGTPAVGTPYQHPSGRSGQVVAVPDSTPNGHGARIEVSAPGYVPLEVAGFLQLDAVTMLARVQVDDFRLTKEATAPPEPGPGPTPPPTGEQTPLQILQEVQKTGGYDLSTHDGCGAFTEAGCDALRAKHSTKWGHVDKNPGQNQYHGHAVDALMLAGAAKGTEGGIYDIIFSSVSPEAEVAFNWVEPPNLDLWIYPPEAALLRFNTLARAL